LRIVLRKFIHQQRINLGALTLLLLLLSIASFLFSFDLGFREDDGLPLGPRLDK
jgi:hypothetical protein